MSDKLETHGTCICSWGCSCLVTGALSILETMVRLPNNFLPLFLFLECGCIDLSPLFRLRISSARDEWRLSVASSRHTVGTRACPQPAGSAQPLAQATSKRLGFPRQLFELAQEEDDVGRTVGAHRHTQLALCYQFRFFARNQLRWVGAMYVSWLLSLHQVQCTFLIE